MTFPRTGPVNAWVSNKVWWSVWHLVVRTLPPPPYRGLHAAAASVIHTLRVQAIPVTYTETQSSSPSTEERAAFRRSRGSDSGCMPRREWMGVHAPVCYQYVCVYHQ